MRCRLSRVLLLCFTNLFFSEVFVVATCCCCSASPIISSLCVGVVVVGCRSVSSAFLFAFASCFPVNLFANSSYFHPISCILSLTCDFCLFLFDVDCLLHRAFLPKLFRQLLFSPPFFVPHGNQKCKVTDLWPQSK